MIPSVPSRSLLRSKLERLAKIAWSCACVTTLRICRWRYSRCVRSYAHSQFSRKQWKEGERNARRAPARPRTRQLRSTAAT